MHRCRLHITGASGCGTTTLARAVADLWAVPHADVDDYFWRPTVPAFTVKRPEAERIALMQDVFVPRDAWVLSGSLMGWGDGLSRHFDAIVFLALEPDVRLARLAARERARYGGAIAPGGPLEEQHQAFMQWARDYDDPRFTGRSRSQHEAWLATVACPVLRLDSRLPVSTLVREVSQWHPRPMAQRSTR